MDTEQLIAEVARETGVRLNKADPILSAAVLYAATFDKALAKLDRQVKAQADRITVASNQAVVDAKKEAEALLSEAGEWIEARIKAAGEAAAASVISTLRQETEKAERARRTTVRLAWAMGAMSLVVLSAVGGMLLAGLR